jgi:uncharacterized protein (DUF58 family)
MARAATLLPTLPPLFPADFRTRLHALVGRPVAFAGAPDPQQRARRSVLSQSGTFVGHRPYERGDDLRRIDWSAYARTGQLFVKQLEQEQRRTAALLLDLSPSTFAGSVPRRLHLLRGAAVVGGLALVQLDALVVLAPGAGAQSARTFAGASALPDLLAHLDALPAVAASPQDAIALALQRSLPGRVHWFADFAVPSEVERPLFALRRRGAAVTGWLPELPEDRQGPSEGYLRMADPETGAELVVPVDEAFAAELRRQLALLASRQDRLFAQAGARLVRWRAPAADDFSTAAFAPLLARSES